MFSSGDAGHYQRPVTWYECLQSLWHHHPNGLVKLVLLPKARQRQRSRTLTPGDAELVTFDGIVETKDVCRKAWLFAPSAVRTFPRERVRCEGEAEHMPRFTT